MTSLSEWTLWEIEYQREGLVERPVTEELQGCGSSTAVPRGTLDIEALASGIHVLKCKPGFWRLYFSVIDRQRRILLLLAVAKKKWKRNPNDLAKASRRFDDYRGGRARACEVRLAD